MSIEISAACIDGGLRITIRDTAGEQMVLSHVQALQLAKDLLATWEPESPDDGQKVRVEERELSDALVRHVVEITKPGGGAIVFPAKWRPLIASDLIAAAVKGGN